MSASEPGADAANNRGRFHAAIWILIYGGLVAISLGLFFEPQAGVLRTAFLAGGSLAVLAGIVLIVIRSRQVKS